MVFIKAVTSFHPTNIKSVSGSACKELGSHHSTLVDWKTNNSSEIPEGGTQDNLLPPRLEQQFLGAETHKWQPPQEPVLRKGPRDRNSQSPGGCVSTSLRVTSPVTGVSHTSVSFTPEPNQVPVVDTGEESPHTSGRGIILEIRQTFCAS